MSLKNPIITTVLGASSLAAAVVVSALAWAAPAAAAPSGYHVVKTIIIGSAKGWDYLTMDSATRLLYIGASDHLDVVDVDSGTVAGKVSDLPEVHGIALAPDLRRGFTTNGETDSSTIVDLKTLKKIGSVKTGKSPDSMVYDGFTKRVFIMNAGDNSATAINAVDGTVAGTVVLGGRPEFAVADGKGNVFVNITDKSQMLKFDGKRLAVLQRWPLVPCDTPSGLSMDRKNRRLFSVCQNKMMVVMNADTGKWSPHRRSARAWTPVFSIRTRNWPLHQMAREPSQSFMRILLINSPCWTRSQPSLALGPWLWTRRRTTSFSLPGREAPGPEGWRRGRTHSSSWSSGNSFGPDTNGDLAGGSI